MKTQRKRYSAEFKARIALAALREQQTINEIASEYAIHPSLVSLWKKQALEDMPALFNNRRETNHQEDEALRDQLYQQIGQLKVEVDFLKKKPELPVEPRRFKSKGSINSSAWCDNVNSSECLAPGFNTTLWR